MKRLLVLLILACFVSLAQAQLKVASPDQINKFFKTKTLVVLTEDMLSDYDQVIQEAIKKHWTITEFDFIGPAEFPKYAMKKEYSFLVLSSLKVTHKKEAMTFKVLNFVLGGVSKDLNRMPDLGTVPVLFEMLDASPSYYKLASIILFMQKNIQFLKGNPETTTPKLIKHYNKQKNKINENELWLLEEELGPNINTLNKIKQIYTYPVKIVSAEELREAIEEQKEGVCFLYKIAATKRLSQGKTVKMILSTKGDLYYLAQHTVNSNNPDAFLDNDLKSIK